MDLGKEQPTMASQQKAKITLYWLDKSRSQRILWLLEELKVDYELKTYKRSKDMLAPKELKDIHPLGKSPVVTIDVEGLSKPIVLAESGLVVEYLIDHFGPHLAPKRYLEGKENQVGGETEEWLRYRYYMHYAEGSIMPILLVALLASNIRKAPVPFFIRPITNNIAGRIESLFLQPSFKTHFEFLESQLATSPNRGQFLCGDKLTGADIIMSFPLLAARDRAGLTKEKYPKLWEFTQRIEEEDGNKRAIQKIIDSEGSYTGTI